MGVERTLRLLGRPGCHLCDVMEAAVREVAVGRPVTVEKIDVDRHPELREAYGEVVPVLMEGERELARIRVSRRRLETLLADQLAD